MTDNQSDNTNVSMTSIALTPAEVIALRRLYCRLHKCSPANMDKRLKKYGILPDNYGDTPYLQRPDDKHEQLWIYMVHLVDHIRNPTRYPLPTAQEQSNPPIKTLEEMSQRTQSTPSATVRGLQLEIKMMKQRYNTLTIRVDALTADLRNVNRQLAKLR